MEAGAPRALEDHGDLEDDVVHFRFQEDEVSRRREGSTVERSRRRSSKRMSDAPMMPPKKPASAGTTMLIVCTVLMAASDRAEPEDEHAMGRALVVDEHVAHAGAALVRAIDL